MRALLPVLLLLVAACDEKPAVDPAWFRSQRWDDGKAVVCVYRGRLKRYDQWREAEVRDYLIREYLDRKELTKRDEVTAGLVPAIKVNRQVTFTTGTYQYRLMHSLFFHRETGELLKAVASSQEGCGLVFSRWDFLDRRLRWDSYWEGEGVGARPLPKHGQVFFADELPFLAPHLRTAAVRVYPSLLRNRLGGARETSRTVRSEGRRAVVKDAAGAVAAEFVYDADGFLERWTVPGAQEFERVARRRMYYWQFTDPGDEKRLLGADTK
ncbi:MAG: hypothetical protein ACYS0K_19825 [Planctomycetota bacterium]|jgi:hypothetical protein